MPIIEGTLGAPLQSAGAPSAGTDEIQTLTIDATGGTFRLAFQGFPTADISWSATNSTLVANIDAALEALPSVGTGGVTTAVGTMTAGVGTITMTLVAQNGKKAVPTIAVANNSLTGTATCSVAETTPGVDATGRGALKGSFLTDTTNGIAYVNSGTPAAPTWTKIGTQT